MYLQLILSHNRCHCNQSCHSTQGSFQLLPGISVTPLYPLLPLLSALVPSLLDFIKMCSFSFLLFWQTFRPPASLLSCILPNNIHSPTLQSTSLSFTLVSSAVLHLSLHFYFDTSRLTIPSALISLTFLPPFPFPRIYLFLFVTSFTHPHTTIFSCPAATRNKPSQLQVVCHKTKIALCTCHQRSHLHPK